MDISDFGVFILLNSTMMFTLNIVNSLVSAPMMIYYNEYNDSDKKSYYSGMFIINSLLIFIFIPFILLFYLIFQNLGLSIIEMIIFPITLFFFCDARFYAKSKYG